MVHIFIKYENFEHFCLTTIKNKLSLKSYYLKMTAILPNVPVRRDSYVSRTNLDLKQTVIKQNLYLT